MGPTTQMAQTWHVNLFSHRILASDCRICSLKATSISRSTCNFSPDGDAVIKFVMFCQDIVVNSVGESYF